ncbi:hypothetical protein [Arthrobacter sp. NtRootA1]|uniref:hypothetical protein n=1 Tax=Arthrobacter sp. NtRootA1 TaxID=2830983 RepID=UPI001CC3AC77|nr:hypothetical protein [Arthrobacter sp. NtRootA1]BCW07732.1 hypothetical protein NtRootA1_38700 [Arthrobacter sp. NtRootA1]
MTNDTDGPAYGQTDVPEMPGQQPQPFAPPGVPPYGSPQPFAAPAAVPAPHHYQQPPLPYQPYYQQQPFQHPGFGPPPFPQNPPRENWSSGSTKRFGPSFWIVGALLAVLALANAVTGNGESILIFIGLAAVFTGLYSLLFKRPSWAALTGKQAAIVVAVAGAASLFLGVVAAGTEAVRDSAVAAARQAPSTTQDGTIQDGTIQDGTIQDGTWIVGKDIAPGTYRTTHDVSRSCSWQITRPGSIDSSEGAVTSGFPVVKLVRGQRFISEGCGGWVKR